MKIISIVALIGIITLCSHATTTGVLRAKHSLSGGGNSFSTSLSDDGRHVVFLSHANNLVTNDSLNPWMDVFLRDLSSGTTRLISVDSSNSGGGSNDSTSPAVSSNGQWVVFTSSARNLVSDDTNGWDDVFLRDVQAETTLLVSGTIGGANGPSEEPLISSDGRSVIYESRASNLVPNDVNGTQDIFIYDRTFGSNRLVNTAPLFGLSFPNRQGPSHSPAMTADGQRIAYTTSATNFTMNVANAISYGEVYFRDLQTAHTHWVSSGVASNFVSGTPYACYNPSISGDGEMVVFKASSSNSMVNLYRRRNLTALGNYAELIASNASARGMAQVSFDGRFVAYEATDGIRVWDDHTESNRLVMANLSGSLTRTCYQPAFVDDETAISFFVASNGFTTILRHDYTSDTTKSAVSNSEGAPMLFSENPGPLISSDISRVIFDSADDSLVTGDENRASDVFAYSVINREIELVSARTPERPSVTPPVASFRSPTSISANGQIATVSTTDWSQMDTNQALDLYVHRTDAGEEIFLGEAAMYSTQAILNANGRYAAYLSVPFNSNIPWFGPQNVRVIRRDLLTEHSILIHSNAVWSTTTSTVAISPDGNLVAFVDQSSLPFGNGNPNIYVRDVLSGTISLASTKENPVFPPGIVAGQGLSNEPQFSPDGQWLLFVSTAQNLTTNSVSGVSLYARDLHNRRTLWVSPLRFPNEKRAVSFSADSRFVACIDTAVSPDPRAVVFDLMSGSTARVPHSVDARSVSISSNGRWVAFDGRPTFGQHYGVYVRDTYSQVTEFLSVPLGNTNISTGSSSHPQISHDGRYVVFASDATNLVAGDHNNAKDVFIRDRWRNVTMLASVNRSGTGSGNGASLLPVLAADGRTLLFQSFASDLIEGDYNETADVFVLRLGSTDTDGDGMDDDWEVAYFGNLARDGAGDLDEDGALDKAEHQLGTDPTNFGSVFQVLKLSRENGQGTKLLWSATPGRSYRVQFKGNLEVAGWSDASEPVTAAGTTAAWIEDPNLAATHRYYRVQLVD